MRTFQPTILLVLCGIVLLTAGCKTTIRHGDASVTLRRGCVGGYPGSLTIVHVDDDALALFEKTGCKSIQGDLTLNGFSGTALPDVIQHLTAVHGSVRIRDTSLVHLDFPVLSQIGDGHGVRSNLMIGHNDKLDSIGHFSALKSVDGDITISRNPLLHSAGEWEELERVKGSLHILENDALEATPAFPKLDRVGNNVLLSNAHVRTIGEFDVLTRIGGSLSINDNPRISSLPHFPKLETIENELGVFDNAMLKELVGFPSLQHVGHERIYNNPLLPQCLVDTLGDQLYVSGQVKIEGNRGDNSICFGQDHLRR